MRLKIEKNVGDADRMLRISLGFGLILTALILGENGGPICLFAALAAFVTAFTSYCPAYVPFSFSTRKQDRISMDVGSLKKGAEEQPDDDVHNSDPGEVRESPVLPFSIDDRELTEQASKQSPLSI